MSNTNKEKVEETIFDNLGLLLEHSDVIINTPQYAGIKMPSSMFGMHYAGHGPRVTLGQLLAVLQSEECFNSVCPYCGSRACLVYFSGSPLSGIVYFAKYICISSNCKKALYHEYNVYDRDFKETPRKHPGKPINGPRGGTLRLAKTAMKYKTDINEDPIDIEQLLDILQN